MRIVVVFISLAIMMGCQSNRAIKNPNNNEPSVQSTMESESISKAQQGDVEEQVFLGWSYYYGSKDIPQNFKKAEKWFLAAANQNSLEAKKGLSMLYFEEKKYNLAAKWAKDSAENGVAFSQYLLGYLYLQGEGVSHNDQQAFKWISKAANNDISYGAALVSLHAQGIGTPKDCSKALRWYFKIAENNDSFAKTTLQELKKEGCK